MDEIYAARYRRAGDAWSTVMAPCLLGVEALDALWQHGRPAHVAGNAVAAFAGRLRVDGSQVAAPQSRGAALGRLVQAAWQAGAAVDAALALPVYVRDKVAQTTAERDAARAAKVIA